MIAKFSPSKAKGVFVAPPSKSIAHRLLLCAGLSEGESIIRNIDYSDDVVATLRCLKALGAVYKTEDTTIHIKGVDVSARDIPVSLPCNECGSTLRFFLPLCLTSKKKAILNGSETLISRPMSVYERICKAKGIKYKKKETSITVKGQLKPGEFQVKGNVSSQFISGLMFTLPLLKGDSKILITPPIESRPYIDMTMLVMSYFGVKATWEGPNAISVRGNQKYHPINMTVEGDWSNSSFFEALNTAGGEVEIQGLSEDSIQGDRKYREFYEALEKDDEPELNLADYPDLAPILFVYAALNNGAIFKGISRLKAKESRRGEVLSEEMLKMGALLAVGDNSAIVSKAKDLHAPKETLNGHNDHRIVMALSILLTVTGGEIDGAESVEKSMPGFFDELKKLGIEVELID